MKRLALFFLLVFTISCKNEFSNERISNQNYFKKISKNDLSLSKPKEGEWLFHHKETGQSLEEYINKKPLFPSNDKNKIYLLPYGKFSKSQDSVMQITREYIEVFFQTKAILLPAIPDDEIPKEQRRIGGEGQEQINATYLLNQILINKTPQDGLCLMAISEKDLYPKDDWNYVFGLASYEKRVGVSSIFRLEDQEDFSKTLGRLINVSSHEIGHMMSMKHCIHAQCLMNGSNSMEETDKNPNRLCSLCQAKMSYTFQFDPLRRLNSLINFFKIYKLNSDEDLLEKDYKAYVD